MSWSCSSSYRGLPACCRVAILLRVAMLAAAAAPTLQPWEGPAGVCGGFTCREGEESASRQGANRQEETRAANRRQDVRLMSCALAPPGGPAHLLLLLLGGLVVVDQPQVGLVEGQLGGEVGQVVATPNLTQDVGQDALLLLHQPVLKDQHDELLIRL